MDWVQVLLSKYHFKVRVNGQVSDSQSTENGGPQWSVLGVISQFVNDLLSVLEGLVFTDNEKYYRTTLWLQLSVAIHYSGPKRF